MGRVRYFIVGIPINKKEYTAFWKAQQNTTLAGSEQLMYFATLVQLV